MWKLKESAEGGTRAENIVKLKAKLETCRSIVSGQGHFEVGVAQPGFEGSKLLTHPLAIAAGGDPNHGGGKHFASQQDPEWSILKAFVFGAK